MLVRLLILTVLAGLAVIVAMLLQRRRPDAPSAPSYRAPTQLDPSDFLVEPATSSSAFIVMFGSTTCDTCPTAWDTVQAVAASPILAVNTVRVDVQTDPELHKRYRIDGVPTTVACSPDGAVQKTFFGVVDPEALEAALA